RNGSTHAVFVIHQPPQEETSVKIFQDQENVINSVQTFLRKFNRYSFLETPKVLLLAWDTVSEIKNAFENKQYKPEYIQELFRKHFNDVQNIHEELAKYINTPSWNRPIVYYDDDDDDDDEDEDYTIAITPVLPTEEPKDSLIMGNEHLDDIPEKESDECIKSSVENVILSLSEFEDIFDGKCDLPLCDDFPKNHLVTFSNPFFDIDNDFTSSDDESFFEEDVPMENFRIFYNPLFDLDEESFLPREVIDLFLTLDDSMPPGIENDDYDSKVDIIFLEELLRNDSSSLPENKSFHFDVPSSPRPPAKPPDDDGIFFDDEPDTGLLTAKVVGDIFERCVHVPNV
nr:hypothetical protein [Tanacetum cinerariifolium]